MSRKRDIIVSLLVLSGAFSCEGVSAANDERRVTVPIGEYDYSIPAAYIASDIVPSWLDRVLKQLPRVQEVNISIPTVLIRSRAPQFPQSDNLVATVKKKGEMARRAAFYQQLAEDIWYARGRFAHRTFEPVAGRDGLFRALIPNQTETWEVVRFTPSGNEPLRVRSGGFYVATCTATIHQDRSRGACEVAAEVDDLIVKFSLEERDLAVVDDVREYLAKLIVSWRRKA